MVTLQELKSAEERESLLAQLGKRRAASALREIYTSAIVKHGSGLLTDDDCLAITSAFELRLKELGEQETVAQRVPHLAERWREQGLSRFKPHLRKKMPDDRAESLRRRRKLAASGYLPAELAQQFSTGHQAVLAVIAQEIGKLGTCSLVIEKIGALAGVCHATVRRAIAQAVQDGLLFVQDRPVRGGLNLSNIVTIRSAIWIAWIKRRFTRKRPLAAVQEAITKLAGPLFQARFNTKCNPTLDKLEEEGNRLVADYSVSVSHDDFQRSAGFGKPKHDNNATWALE